MVRTRLTVASGETQGWSFSLEHDASGLTPDGGELTLTDLTTEGTGVPTINGGSPPSYNFMSVYGADEGGYTQAIVIDGNQEETLAPVAGYTTSIACYHLRFPFDIDSFSIPFAFTHALGSPPVRSVVTQDSASNVPCARNFDLELEVVWGGFMPDGGCGIAEGAGAQSGGGGGASSLEPAPPAGGGMAEPEQQGQQQGQQADCSLPVPQPEELEFLVRGDANGDGVVDVSDSIANLSHQFLGKLQSCEDALDADDNGAIDITDAIVVLSHLFLGAAPFPSPFPGCGLDPSPDPLDCESYDASTCNPDSDGDGLFDGYELAIGTDPQDSDTDDDGFTDGEEVLSEGVPGCGAGSFVISDLGDESAHPLCPDIYVEIDWMVAADHTHGPFTSGVLEAVIRPYFESLGWRLHVDLGAATFPGGEGGTDLGHADNLSAVNTDEAIFAALDQIKQNPVNFDPDRCKVFHYNIWVHNLAPGRDNSGIGELPGDDFIVSLGSFFIPPRFFGTPQQQAGTFVHELGHNFGLRHGGDEDLNFKPNYRSVMNYMYQFGVDVDCDVGPACNTPPEPAIKYSDETLDSLDENALVEGDGICGTVAIDWNGDGDSDDTDVELNINGDSVEQPLCPGPPEVLRGFNDLEAIDLNFRDNPLGLFNPDPFGNSPALRCRRP